MTHPAAMRSWRHLLGLLSLFLLVCSGLAADRLPGMDADLSATSVSGISSGGYMAVQFHVVHSAIVIGAGILAAGPYYCAEGNAGTAYYNCTEPGPWNPLPPLNMLSRHTDALAKAARIDPIANLRRAKVWLFSGTRDRKVSPEVVDALAQYYRSYLAPGAVAYVHDIAAGHGMVTADFGAACEATRAPYLNDCKFDAAGQLLSHILGTLQPAAQQPSGRMVAFDQAEFTAESPHALSLSDIGYAAFDVRQAALSHSRCISRLSPERRGDRVGLRAACRL